MKAYVIRRALLVLPTLLGVSALAFLVANLAPGDPAVEFFRQATGEQPTAAQVAALHRRLGHNHGLVVRFLTWLFNAAHANLGLSYSTRRPVTTELVTHLPATLELAVPAALLAAVVGTTLGTLSVRYRGALADHAVRLGALAGASMPSFALGLVLIVLLSVDAGWLPVAGRSGLSSFVLPTLTLAAAPAAVMARFTRAAMLEVLGEDFVRTARAKGLAEGAVMVGHVLRNGLGAGATVAGTSLGYLMAGVVIVEDIFSWPGVGQVALSAMLDRDYPLIQGVVLYTGATFVLVNFAIDVALARIDPRIRLDGFRRDTAP